MSIYICTECAKEFDDILLLKKTAKYFEAFAYCEICSEHAICQPTNSVWSYHHKNMPTIQEQLEKLLIEKRGNRFEKK